MDLTITQIDNIIKYLNSKKNIQIRKSRFGNDQIKLECDEDGESSILGNQLQPGRYVAIGHQKCLSIEELISMSDTGKFLRNSHGNLINPFTRQEYSPEIIDKINDLLEIAGKPRVENGIGNDDPIINRIRRGQMSRDELFDRVVSIGENEYSFDISHVLSDYPEMWRYSDGILTFNINNQWINAADLGPGGYEYLGYS
jgi:hypothetical protein